MSIKGFIDYERREFCKDVMCPVQVKLNNIQSNSEEYENVRKTCSENCVYSTWDFHHWLIEKGYLIVKPKGFEGK